MLKKKILLSGLQRPNKPHIPKRLQQGRMVRAASHATIQPKEMPLFFSCRWRSPSGKTGCRAQLAKDSFRPQRAEIAGGGSLAQVSWRAGFLAASAVRSPELITWCGITEHRLCHANRNAHTLSLCRSRILIKRTTAIRLWLMTFLLPPLSSSAPDPALPY